MQKHIIFPSNSTWKEKNTSHHQLIQLTRLIRPFPLDRAHLSNPKFDPRRIRPKIFTFLVELSDADLHPFIFSKNEESFKNIAQVCKDGIMSTFLQLLRFSTKLVFIVHVQGREHASSYGALPNWNCTALEMHWKNMELSLSLCSSESSKNNLPILCSQV